MLPTLSEVEAAARVVYAAMAPTAQLPWPLLAERCGAEVWVKHESDTPIGAFKVRGGLVYLAELLRARPRVAGVVAATRGNHGQSVALAARRAGVPATIVVPHGNSVEKSAGMRAFGAMLVEHGRDYQEAYEHARALAASRDLHLVPTFHPWLLRGVASFALELFRAVDGIDALYVPIGLGSVVCSAIAMRDALGLATRIVGVVAERAPAYALSLERGAPVAAEPGETLADGLAVRLPDETALAVIRGGADRVLRVSEPEIEAAMRHFFTDTHHLAEGAGAAALAGLLQDRARVVGRRVAVVLSGANVDRSVYARVLAGGQDAESRELSA